MNKELYTVTWTEKVTYQVQVMASGSQEATDKAMQNYGHEDEIATEGCENLTIHRFEANN